MRIDLEKMQARVEKMSEGQLLAWLEAAIPGMQRHLEQYQKTGIKDHFGELAIAETTANLVITELMGRMFPAPVVAGEAETIPALTAPSEPKTDTGTTFALLRFRRGRRAKTGPASVQSAGTSELFRLRPRSIR